MGMYQAQIALHAPSPSIPHALALVMERYRDWWDWYSIEPAGTASDPMVFIDIAGDLHSQFRPDEIADDGEAGKYIPLEEWRAELADLRDSCQSADIVTVRCKW